MVDTQYLLRDALYNSILQLVSLLNFALRYLGWVRLDDSLGK